MMSFVRPALLGPPTAFQRVFVAPIEASQQAGASDTALEVGRARETELSRRIAPFLLRRTADVNSKYLPECKQYVVFVRPTRAQLAAYQEVLATAHGVQRLLETSSSVETAQVLTLITKLRQACNHPALVRTGDEVRALTMLCGPVPLIARPASQLLSKSVFARPQQTGSQGAANLSVTLSRALAPAVLCRT